MDSQPSPSPSPRRGRGCLLWGCAALLFLVLVPPLVVWGLLSAAGRVESDPQEAERVHALPGAAAEPLAAAEEAPTAAPGAEETATPLPVQGSDEPAPVPGAGQGRIVLDVRFADLEVVPVPAGQPLRLRASYDASRFRLDERLREEPGGWVYHLTLDTRGLLSWLRRNEGASYLVLEVPQGVSLVVEGSVGLGRSDLELGGLALSAVDLDLGVGQHRVSFREPTQAPMALLSLDSAMGELTIDSAGNASPRRIEIDHGMGQLELDLSGAWRNDGEVDLELGMGDCRVNLPDRDEAGGIVVDSDLGLGERDIRDVAETDLPPGLPRVRIHTSGGMGSLRVR